MMFWSFAYRQDATDIGFGNRSRTSRAHHEVSAATPEVLQRRCFDLRRMKMNTSLNHGSARIYQFPAGGRSALGGRRYEEAKVDTDRLPVSEADCSGSWYHEAAIQEAKPKWER
jgi:hypothetical protein